MKAKSKKKKTGAKKNNISSKKKAGLKRKPPKKSVARSSGSKKKAPKKKKAVKKAATSVRKKTAKKTTKPVRKRMAKKATKLVRKKAVKKTAKPVRKQAAKKQFTPLIRDLKAVQLEKAVEVLNPNWQATAQFENTGEPITSFSCSMIVPNEPDEQSGQTIMIFNGLQSGRRILQPILQWGRSQMAGGGPFWTVGCCLAAGQITLEEESVLTRVDPGDRVTAVITLLGSEGNRFRYSCFFEGIEASRIQTNAIDELTNCCVTLEAVRVNTRQRYPADPSIAITDIILRNRGRIVTPAWQTGGASNIGEEVELRRVPGSPDEIDILF